MPGWGLSSRCRPRRHTRTSSVAREPASSLPSATARWIRSPASGTGALYLYAACAFLYQRYAARYRPGVIPRLRAGACVASSPSPEQRGETMRRLAVLASAAAAALVLAGLVAAGGGSGSATGGSHLTVHNVFGLQT